MTNQPRMKIWISLFVLVVFLIGLGAGVVASPWLGGRSTIDAMFGPSGPSRRGSRPPMRARLMERLSSSFELTDAQTDRLETLFDARRDRVREISREMRQRFDRERETFRTALAEILTAEQMAQFEAEIVRMGEERRRRGDRRGDRGDGRPPRP